MSEVPARLIEEIRGGNCVAFVGAGFSASVVPGWASLLHEVAASSRDLRLQNMVRDMLGPRSRNTDLEAAAQLLRDRMGDAFDAVLQRRLAAPPLDAQMSERLRLLKGVPFRAVLTTNFDGLLQGDTPGRETYLKVLRPEHHRWWEQRFWAQDRPGAQVVKLHGDVSKGSTRDLVFSRRDYRQRLYSDPGYTAFLRAVFSTTTVLYLGFSFTDAYLNELRSEVLALLGQEPADEPIAYAVVNDVPAQTASYFARHEGVGILSYDSRGGSDFSGFDHILSDIHARTSPPSVLGELLSGKRLLWVDARPRKNDYGMQFLQEAAHDSAGAGGCEILQVTDWKRAITALEQRHYDLVITHWGHGLATAPGVDSAAERLLLEMRHRDCFAPVLVFASGTHADVNKRRAMAMGAVDYTCRWSSLFRKIAELLSPGSKTA